jgi:DNA repair protein RadD
VVAFGELSDEDRATAVTILNRRLHSTDFRTILDSLDLKRRKSVEQIVVATENNRGRGRPRVRLPEDQLAQLLVDRLGSGLLESPELRRLLAFRATDDERELLHEYEHGRQSRGGKQAQASAISTRKWSPGKSWPRCFVRVLDFPAVFAGLPGSPAEPPTLEVAPFVPLPSLADFQEDLKRQALTVLDGPPGANRGVLTMPTGAGKTRTAVESLLSWRLSHLQRPVILWIAQSEELCEQAVQAFAEVWTDLGQRRERVRETLEIARFWGPRPAVPEDPDIVVASIQKLFNAVCSEDQRKRDALTALSAGIGVVVVDEAHRINAPSYHEVLKFIRVDLSTSGKSQVPLLGLTATPFRSDTDGTRRLVRIFHNRLLESDSLGEDMVGALRARRVLAAAEHEVLEYGAPVFDMERSETFVKHFDQFNDFHADFLREVAEDETRNRALFEKLMKIPESWPTLFFGCTVEHAVAMSVLLRRKGRAAEVITGQTRSATRRALIEEFRAGRLSVLCNFGVLTTGFDAPKVRALVVGRPTTSRVLYEQMIGRGMRGPEFGGTELCQVIDVQDNIKFHGELAYKKYARYWAKD